MPPQCDRTAAPRTFIDHLHAHLHQRIQNAPHGTLSQRRIAVKLRLDAVATDDTHHQPRSRACIAEVERLGRLTKMAAPGTIHAPMPFAETLDNCAQCATSSSRSQHVVAFQQTADFRTSLRQQAEDQRSMGYRFVAGRSHVAAQSAARDR